MNIQNWKKMVAVLVLLAFAALAVARDAEEGAPGFQEKERAPVVRKHRKFPWLPVILGAGAGVVLVVLLTKKKQHSLTVNLGFGCAGTPAATAKFKKGTVVRYDYAPKAGFGSLHVRLDNVVVAASGTVTMDRDHCLDVAVSEQFTLSVSLGAGTGGTPAATASYGKGQVVPYSYAARAGAGRLQVRLDNVVVAPSGTVTMNADHSLAVAITQDSATFRNGVLTVNGIRYEMALIPPGEFRMGSDGPEAADKEQPVHTVLISKPFWFGRTEVTQGLWRAVMGYNPSKFKNGDDYPVEEASWDECQKFIQSLNQMLAGNAFRLPTEAQWEYACRAGTTAERYGELDAIAWCARNSGGRTHPVGQKQPNAFGLYDMLGNVWEYCQDLYLKYRAGYQIDPSGESPGQARIYRGGGWDTRDQDVRAAYRDMYHRNIGPPRCSVGLRLARTND